MSEKVDIISTGIPEEICLMVKYRPKGLEDGCPFYIDLAQGPKFKPYLLGIRDIFPKIAGNTINDEIYVFGHPDHKINEKIADYFAVYDFPTSKPIEGSEFFVENAEPSSKVLDYYPWDSLREIGDHFLVINGNAPSISVACHHQARMKGKEWAYRTSTVDEGVLVILVKKPSPTYSYYVEIKSKK